MNLKIEKKQNSKKIEIAEGSIVDITHDTKIEFQLFNDDKVRYISKFNIIQNPNDNLILGMRFLTENDAVINLKENYIIIDKLEYEIDISKNLMPEENLIYEKVKMCKEDDLSKIEELIRKAKMKNKEMGEILNFEHEIPLTDEFKAIPKEYYIPLNIRRQVSEHLKELIKDGIIEESYSQCISPAFIILKINGKVRLVVDYRYLNSITKKTHQFTPRISDILSTLNGSKVFSKIDLNQGYYQIKVKDEDVYKTGFRILNRTFVFKRMPFGLCNAPATFQLAMNRIFKDIENVHVYLDDILVYSKNFETHIETLKQIFERISENNISINFEKSQFGVSETEFLGHIINSEGVRPNTIALKDFKVPEKMTKKKLEKILGLINWFRPYIHNLSGYTKQLYNKLKNKKIEWSKGDTELITKIISKINSKPLLNYPDLNENFELFCDASDAGMGAVLFQKNKLIGFSSSTYKGAENNYTIPEKEMLSILRAFQKFKNLLFNAKTTIFTDNRNITTPGCLTKRMNRWKLILQEYDHEIKHIEGKRNVEADMLSRAGIFKISNANEYIYENLCSNFPQSILNQTVSNSNMKVSNKNITEFIKNIHIKLLHPGSIKMYLTLKRYINLKNLKYLCNKVTSTCTICLTEKNYYKPTILPDFEFKTKDIHDVVSLDIKGPIPVKHFKIPSKKKKFFILVMTDIFSRFSVVSILYDINSETVTSTFENEWIKRFKPPKRCLTDNGRQFTSKSFSDLLLKYGIKHNFSSPYNPKGNSIIERINREIGTVLRISRNQTLNDIKRNIFIKLNLNANSTTEVAPYELFFQKPIFSDYKGVFNINYREILDKLIKKHNNYLIKKNFRKSTRIREGQYVYIKKFTNDKIDIVYTGPFKILRVANNRSHVIVDKISKLIRVSINHIIPVREGENVEVVTPPLICNLNEPQY
ncbi:Transposon Tf2-9 polyprotein [Dictyocoela muelleri]|nr:Transposon Tf2-9 polyprotein [Dictyocoela muelleri]